MEGYFTFKSTRKDGMEVTAEKKLTARIEELENCDSFEEIDAFLVRQGKSTTLEKCRFLSDYMGVKGFHFLSSNDMDGNTLDSELLYTLLRESFCDGEWRLLCGWQE
jgi:HKD family nuclease